MKKQRSLIIIAATTLITCLFIFYSLLNSGNYGWTLFLTVPFLIFLYAGYLTTNKESSFAFGRLIFIWTLVLIGFCGLLLLLQFEGAICIALAAPIIIFPSLFGFFIGYIIKKTEIGRRTYSLIILLGIIPISQWFEHLNEGVINSNISTSITLNYSQQEVWDLLNKEVIFNKDVHFLFQQGVTLPTKMMVSDSTNELIVYTNNNDYLKLPLSINDSNKSLVFNPGLENTPEPMKELSPYGNFDAPHLHDYFWIDQGSFELEVVDKTTAIIHAKTNYNYKIGPKFYWKFISDQIIDLLHQHVLHSIKAQLDYTHTNQK